VRRREVRDPSVAYAPRSGGFRRSGRKGVERDLIVLDLRSRRAFVARDRESWGGSVPRGAGPSLFPPDPARA